MKTSIKKQDKCQVRLSVDLDAEEVASVVKDVEKSFMREAQIPGFRKGKVPLALIRKEFASGLKSETNNAILRKYYADAVKAEKLDELSLFNVESVAFDDKGGSFVVLVEVKPVFKLPTYKGLKIAEESTAVSDETVAEQMKRMREMYATYEDAKEGDKVEAGDFVQIDYEGLIDKEKILSINPDAKIVGEGKGFWTQVEDGRFLPEILDAVKGMAIGETKENISAKFDKESAPEGLKGKKATYTVTVKAFRKRRLPDDATFVEKAKGESVEKMTADLRDSLEKAAVRREAARREQEAISLLLKKADFEVPESQVLRATDAYLRDFAERAQYSGIDAEYFEKNREKILADAKTAATNQVRLWYIIDAIAAEEKLEAKDDEKGKKVIDLILANAKK